MVLNLRKAEIPINTFHFEIKLRGSLSIADTFLDKREVPHRGCHIVVGVTQYPTANIDGKLKAGPRLVPVTFPNEAMTEVVAHGGEHQAIDSLLAKQAHRSTGTLMALSQSSNSP